MVGSDTNKTNKDEKLTRGIHGYKPCTLNFFKWNLLFGGMEQEFQITCNKICYNISCT